MLKILSIFFILFSSLIFSTTTNADFKKMNLPVQKSISIPALNNLPKKSEPKMIGLRLGEAQWVTCENCGGKGGTVQDVLCPEGKVIADFHHWVGQFGECDTNWGGCSNHAIVGASEYRCALPEMDKVGAPDSLAKSSSGQTRFGKVESSEIDHWGDGCLYFSSMPYGIHGRAGERIDSFGLVCGSYLRTDVKPQLLQDSPKPSTYQCAAESKYGCSPGTGGAEFEVKCPADSVVVGFRLRTGNDVDGIDGIFCAALLPVHPIFPIEE